MRAKAQRGYRVADISGFTSYLVQVGLDHAHAILTDRLELLGQRLLQEPAGAPAA